MTSTFGVDLKGGDYRTNDQIRPTGGANLPHPTEDEYNNLLKQ